MAAGTIGWLPAGLVALAALSAVTVKLSLFFASLTRLATNAGFASPYSRLASLAWIVSVARPTVSVPFCATTV